MRYNYSIVRVWQLPVEELLAGGIATLPLAPIADVPESDLPRVISRMRERIEAETKDEQQDLWASTYFLMGEVPRQSYESTFERDRDYV